jgi:hypothetical protein
VFTQRVTPATVASSSTTASPVCEPLVTAAVAIAVAEIQLPSVSFPAAAIVEDDISDDCEEDEEMDEDGEPVLSEDDIQAMYGDWVNSGRGFGA